MRTAMRLIRGVSRRLSEAWNTATRPFYTLLSRYVWLYEPLVRFTHAPDRFTRRSRDFTANLCGVLTPSVRNARYRLNDGEWRTVAHLEPRVKAPQFTVELPADELRPGRNRVTFDIRTYRGGVKRTEATFEYDDLPVKLPLKRDWSDEDLEIQDGHWERIRRDGAWVVRPVPGSESYDRILIAAGAFRGARQVETDVVFRKQIAPGRPFGFGILPLWGGRPDSLGRSPRAGWNFGLTWYYSMYAAVGMEFSFKDADDPPRWVAAYRDIDLVRDSHYRIVARCWSERNSSEKHGRFIQQMKWWPANGMEPHEWLEMSDVPGAPIPEGEYGVALIAHQVQVEFGSVMVRDLSPEEMTRSRAEK